MADIVPKEKPKRAPTPKVQDLSELVDQTSRTLLDLDQRIQLMRNDLAAMMQQANAQLPTGVTPSWGPQNLTPGAPYPSAYTPQASYNQPITGGWATAPFAWPNPDPYAARTNPYAPLGAAARPGNGAHAGTFGGAGEALPPTGVGSLAGGYARSTRDLGNMPPVAREPPSDVVDLGQEFQICVDMPGVKKDDLDIMVTDRSVIVTGQAQPELGEGVVVVNERAPIQYRRTITLPSEIQTSKCQAKLKDGVLVITVPKKVPTDGPRHINVAYA